MTLIVGARAPLTWTPDGDGAVTLTVGLPDGTILVPAPTVSGVTGERSASFLATQPGRHVLTWALGDARHADIVDVWPADPRYLVSLDEVLLELGGAGGILQADAIALHVAAATYVIERLAGPVISAARTHKSDGGRGAVVLPACPVQVTGVTVSGTALAASQYDVDEDAGIVYSSALTPGRVNVVVAYRVGAAEIPANLRLAALKLVRHLYQSSRQTRGASAMEASVDTVTTPFGFAIPRAVAELCGLTLTAPGFA